MTKYLVSNYRETITPVECIRETEKFVVLKCNHLGGRTERKEAKDGSYEQYFDTWQDARSHLICRYTAKIKSLEEELATSNQALFRVRELPEVQA